MTVGESVEIVTAKLEKAIEVFEDGTFKLHKWHSNVVSVEENVLELVDEDEPSLLKAQLGNSY